MLPPVCSEFFSLARRSPAAQKGGRLSGRIVSHVRAFWRESPGTANQAEAKAVHRRQPAIFTPGRGRLVLPDQFAAERCPTQALEFRADGARPDVCQSTLTSIVCT
jgi:hypothetical protein